MRENTHSVDLSKIEPGDEVTVRATVRDLHSDRLGLKFSDLDCAWAPTSDVVTHTPKALNVGLLGQARWWLG
jgi:hypothetical protein